MTKNKGFGLIGVIVALAIVALIGGGAYYAMNRNKTDVAGENQASTTAEQSSATGSVDSKSSLRDLLGMGRNLACNFTNTASGTTVSGTVFISGSQMRGDFTSKTGTQAAIDSHMIRTGSDVYIWSSLQGGQGIKMTLTEEQNAGAQGASSMATPADLDEKVAYECGNWLPDTSKFAAPSNVKFMDFSAMMKEPTAS